MATAEKINGPYVSRVLHLTPLTPDIVEAILDDRQPAEVMLAVLTEPFTMDGGKQQELSTQGAGSGYR